MDKPETKANEEWTRQRQRQMRNGHSSFAFVSRLSILHLPLSLVCPFFICLCLWLVHSSFAFVSDLSIPHLPLSLAKRQKQMKNGQARDNGKCGMDKPETKANEEWTSQRQRQMKNGQARDKGK
jgi:tmRNA-binding protein